MSENTLQPFQPVLFFISKVFILIGMVLVFSFAFLGIGLVACKYLFEVDALTNQSILNEYESNIYVLRSLKFIQVLNTIGGFLLPAVLFSKACNKAPSTFIGYATKPSLINILIGIGIMLVSTPLIANLIHWNEAYTFPPKLAELEHKLRDMQTSAEQISNAFVKADGIGALLLNMVIIALVPAVCEEFFFRGALMRFLMLCIKNKHVSVWVTALIFSMMHGEFFGLIPRMVLGVFLGYIAWYSGSIWPAVVAHFLNNGLALISIYFKWNTSGIAFLDDSFVFPIYLVVVSTVITIGLIFFLKRNNPIIEESYGE